MHACIRVYTWLAAESDVFRGGCTDSCTLYMHIYLYVYMHTYMHTYIQVATESDLLREAEEEGTETLHQLQHLIAQSTEQLAKVMYNCYTCA